MMTLLVLVPLTDTLVFGLHEHVADDGRDVAGLHVGHVHSTAHGVHHCDFGMNPAHIPERAVLCPPTPVPRAIQFDRLAWPTPQPFLPFSPPRA